MIIKKKTKNMKDEKMLLSFFPVGHQPFNSNVQKYSFFFFFEGCRSTPLSFLFLITLLFVSAVQMVGAVQAALFFFL
ncbi:hypothetical protein RchiOBHm_Chr2g0164591 [Rosa chinensis]|uniref:Transmembrane protein n=1 Tax=Rosa chinensis TaxID=74649 RepID=A0A2P6S3K5_ROSCH|nr:hypothetical protein RchiOBHm_Chr2g0164591 [Rosa chinensis]